MSDTAIRPWCATAIYPGKREFLLGTITMPANAQSHEVEQALAAHAAEFLPSGFKIVRPICGALFFQESDDAK